MTKAACINCRSADLYKFLDFGLQPNGNRFLETAEVESEPLLPLSVVLCRSCGQVQQGQVAPPEFLFTDHPYLTGINKPYVEHFERLVPRLIRELSLEPGSTVLDIGCNDGTLLSIFARHGVRGLGMDPGSLSGKVAARNGRVVLPTFWNKRSAAHLAALQLRPELIVSTASFYHMVDLDDWVAGLEISMGERSVFVAQCVYLGDIVRNGQVDQFYHEHSCLHSVRPLTSLFKRHGLRLFHVEPIDVQGGSILVFACRDEAAIATRPSVAEFLEYEREVGLAEPATFDRLRTDFEHNAVELNGLLRALKADGRRISAIGGSLRGITLLNFARVPPDAIDRILEVNEYKIGKLAPGLHIPVVDERMETEEPDSYLVLSWTFREYFIEKYKNYLRRGGSLIFPVPRLEIVDGRSIDGDLSE
jgi:SAM-dependent methyltransferase